MARKNSVGGYIKSPDKSIGSATRNDPYGLPYKGPQEHAANKKNANSAWPGPPIKSEDIKKAMRK